MTSIEKLTNHLRSPDFFDARQYPEATFKTSKIERMPNANAPMFQVTGNLTIRDVTKAISFPANIRISDGGVVLESKFKIKRSQFGMTFGSDRVVDEVSISIVVGKKTPALEPEA
jgi:polyisoprenoid-binding protein YceI